MYGLDEYPNGANAVVAVISYTGYDMEDGMIINKSSYERGFGHGTLYKMCEADLRIKKGSQSLPSYLTNAFSNGAQVSDQLDADGLPYA